MEKHADAISRRFNTIAAHFVHADDMSGDHIFATNCSSTLSSETQRRDSRLCFARQGSESCPPFMRQASLIESGLPLKSSDSSSENSSGILNSVTQRRDNKLWFARQGSDSCAPFMRQASKPESGIPLKDSDSSPEVTLNSLQAPPLFSRPTKAGPKLPNVVVQPVAQGLSLTAPEPPKFSRPSLYGLKRLMAKKHAYSSESRSSEWSPRMDVAELSRHYILTVEIPGVSVNDIRVEVDDQKLAVTGQRSGQFWKVSSNSSGTVSTYIKKEILQGPYQAVWALPSDVDKNNVSAEFWEGFLQIIVPKI